MTVRNGSRAFASFPSTIEVFEKILPKPSPFEEMTKGILDRLSPPWLRQCLRSFDDSLLADVDVVKKSIRTSNVIAPFERSLSPYEIEEIARAVAGQIGRKRQRRSDTVIDVEEVGRVARTAEEAVAVPALRSPQQRGRKAKYRLLEQEMQRRADAGVIRGTWQEEIKALRAWMNRLPTDQRPAPKTIYNRHRELRAMYDCLVAGRNVPFL